MTTDAESPGVRRSPFEYDGRSRIRRFLVGMNLKTAMMTTRIQDVEHRSWPKYLLILLLFINAVAFTPSLLPDWLGIEWATARTSLSFPFHPLKITSLKCGSR
jgi:hypothetical protein